MPEVEIFEGDSPQCTSALRAMRGIERSVCSCSLPCTSG